MTSSLQNAFLGSLVADAVSMPVHWYYNTAALDCDFPTFAFDDSAYHAPKKSHPDSILWRSTYRPRNDDADILHDQAQYWGQRHVHYHQFLPAGENTLNFLLAAQLYKSTVRHGGYDPQRWLDIYVSSMRDPDWHNDTYVEEYHRAFFDNRARGRRLEKCGIDDIHIGGLTPVPALLAALDALGDVVNDVDQACETILTHVTLTHQNARVRESSVALVRMLIAIANGTPLREAITTHGTSWASAKTFDRWTQKDDRTIVGQKLSPACYLPDAFTASLYLAYKYADNFTDGIIANARVGGDNCHRGTVVGSLLGAANEIPTPWLENLHTMNRLRCNTLSATF
ncbi:MAG: ADP-ribosylglycohydrolase family protein [Verrucomicrobiota bacterium]